MSHRRAAVLAAALSGLLLSTASALPAAAQPVGPGRTGPGSHCVVSGITRTRVVLHASSKQDVVEKPISTGCDDALVWNVQIMSGSGDGELVWFGGYVYDSHQYSNHPWTSQAPDSGVLGRRDAVVQYAFEDQTSDFPDTTFKKAVLVQRETRWSSFEVSKPRKSAPRTLSTRLRALDVENYAYHVIGEDLGPSWDAVARATVRLQKKDVRGTYTSVKTVRTGEDGRLAVTLPGTGKGTWRLQYQGSSKNAALTSPPETIH